MTALSKFELSEDATNEQKRVFDELQHTEHQNWTIQAKQHLYTDGVNERVSTEGLIVLVKKPLLQMAREIFGLVSIQFPDCLKGKMTILPTGNGEVYEYEGYAAMIARNNDFHNTTDRITIDQYHPDHRELVVMVGNLPAQKAYKILQGIEGVYNVIKTNLSQAKGKYFVLCDREHRREVERMVHEVLKAITLQITDECDEMAEK